MLRHLHVNEHYTTDAKVVFAWEVLDHEMERHMPSLFKKIKNKQLCSVRKTSRHFNGVQTNGDQAGTHANAIAGRGIFDYSIIFK